MLLGLFVLFCCCFGRERRVRTMVASAPEGAARAKSKTTPTARTTQLKNAPRHEVFREQRDAKLHDQLVVVDIAVGAARHVPGRDDLEVVCACENAP